MNMLKKTLTSALLVALVATSFAHARQSPYSTVEEVKLSDNPPTFLESAGYVALFLVTAYIMQKMIPPLPPEEAAPLTTDSDAVDAIAHTLEAVDVSDDGDANDEYNEDSESENLFFE